MMFPAVCLWAFLSLPNSNAWHEVRSEQDMFVWARAVPESNIREVKAETVIEAPIDRVWDVIGDVDNYATFMPYLAEARTITKSEHERLEYFRVTPPFVSQRDYTLRVSTTQDHPKGEFVRKWSADNDHGPPPRGDSVRLHVCDGSWTLQRLADSRTKVTYWVYTDPSGNIPGWLANQANSRSVPDVLNAVRRRALDPQWTR